MDISCFIFPVPVPLPLSVNTPLKDTKLQESRQLGGQQPLRLPIDDAEGVASRFLPEGDLQV